MKKNKKRTPIRRPRSRRYLVMIRRTGNGYSADVPDVPGCVAAAQTIIGTRRLIAEALGLHFELMQESGERIPTPRHSIKFTVDDSTEEELCTWVEVRIPEALSSAR